MIIVEHPHVERHDRLGFVVRGSKVPVRRLWAWHRGGTAIETLVRRYPGLGPARVLDALSFAYDNRDAVDEELEREEADFARQRRGEG